MSGMKRKLLMAGAIVSIGLTVLGLYGLAPVHDVFPRFLFALFAGGFTSGMTVFGLFCRSADAAASGVSPAPPKQKSSG
jgi:hypothetical protein